MTNDSVHQTTGEEAPLIVIVGETASGKSALAIELAELFDGEIICADSRTVYQGMDIGTAKPSTADRQRVRHYGLNLVTADESFTAAQFKAYALRAISDITARGKLPIMVGGSGLYIDAVLYDYQFRAPSHSAKPGDGMRTELQGLSVEQLQQRVLQQGLVMPKDARNPRHLVRTIETGGQLATRSELRPRTLLLGPQVEINELRNRISRRLDSMLKDGLLDEVTILSQMYSWDAAPMHTIGYQEWRSYAFSEVRLDAAGRREARPGSGGEALHAAGDDARPDAMGGVGTHVGDEVVSQDLETIKNLIIRNTMQYAKRQRTWFKRNKSIHWLATDDKRTEAVDYATTFLNK